MGKTAVNTKMLVTYVTENKSEEETGIISRSPFVGQGNCCQAGVAGRDG
jgi:hypothetical protein